MRGQTSTLWSLIVSYFLCCVNLFFDNSGAEMPRFFVPFLPYIRFSLFATKVDARFYPNYLLSCLPLSCYTIFTTLKGAEYMDFSNVTAYLDSLNGRYGLPGVDVMIMKDHKVIYRHQAGYRNHGQTCPLDGTELYDIYSATKVITMVAAMQLIEKELLDLNDPVSKYIPAFSGVRVFKNYTYSPAPAPQPDRDAPTRPAQNPILIHQLMSMTAGLTYDMLHPQLQERAKENADTVSMMEGIARMALLFEPGERYAYSLAHDVIAAVVEIISGERFADYLDAHIFRPLGIKDMYMHPGEKEQPRRTDLWAADSQTGQIREVTLPNIYRLCDRYDSGGAGLCASVEAYCAVMDALACGGVGKTGARILTEESIRTLSTPRLNEQQLQDFGRYHMGYSYGLGVRTLVHQEVAKSPIGEFGWDGAAGAFGMVDPINHVSLFYAQSVLGMMKVYFEIHPALRDLVYEALDEE